MVIFLKGFVIGIGKIIPGVSGSLLAISLGIYEKGIDIISNLFQELRYNIEFLFYLCLGILLSILLGSKLIYFFITNHYFLTMCLFIGLICGTFPNVFGKTSIKSIKNITYIMIPFVIVLFLGIVSPSHNIVISNNISGYFYTIILGFIDSLTMIIPGLSGTTIFMMLGTYDFVLILFSNIFTYFTIFFVIGLILGAVIICRLMNFYFKNYNNEIYLVIIGFSISSIFILLKSTFSSSFSLLEFFIGVLLIIGGFFVSLLFNEK